MQAVVLSIQTWTYLLACLLIPAAWGVAMHALISWLQRRRASRRQSAEPPPIDYSI